MNFAFTEEQEELRSAARAFLADHSSSEQVRRAMESDLGYEPEVWKRVGAELGWTAVTIPEEFGGIGLGDVELVALMEIMGEHLFCAPYFASVCLGAGALLVAGSAEQKAEHLPAIAEGRTLATLAYAESESGAEPTDLAMLAEPADAGFVLRGVKRFVVDGAAADLLVVAAREPGSRGEAGISLFLVPSGSPGLRVTPLPTMDPTRRQAEVALDGVRVPSSARLDGPEGGGASLREILDRAAIALAAEQVGGAQRCLDLSVAYAKEREQFGRPIGSFQAIKHKCADMMVRVESARSAAYYAACVAAEAVPELSGAASLAKAYCSEAYFHCAGAAIQIHGGVGFTWEYDPHLYFKRAQASEHLLGDPTWHRERIARQLCGTP
jgi:alkylation response protein AidB-like acyl-CoA dehydrogenase